MQITSTQLAKHLNAPLKTVYLLTGDELLLVNEARQAIRQAAEQQGFLQRDTYHVDAQFDWSVFYNALDTYHLFSEKTLIELSASKLKFTKATLDYLQRFLASQPTDKCLVIITNKLSAAQKKANWYQLLAKAGVVVSIWPIKPHELGGWIRQRLQKANLEADTDAIHLLAELTTGNLLATSQAIEKLQLLYPNSRISRQAVSTAISNNTRFNLFDLSRHLLIGDTQHALACLQGLKATGTDSVLVLWLLTRELRELYHLTFAIQNGKSVDQAIQHQWQQRKPMLKRALQRLSQQQLITLLHQAESIDHLIKGLATGSAWQALARLCLHLCATQAAS